MDRRSFSVSINGLPPVARGGGNSLVFAGAAARFEVPAKTAAETSPAFAYRRVTMACTPSRQRPPCLLRPGIASCGLVRGQDGHTCSGNGQERTARQHMTIPVGIIDTAIEHEAHPDDTYRP